MASVAMEVPFHIDGAGRVAQATDLGRQIMLRMLTLIGTSYTERVLRPLYGTRAATAVFDVNDPLSQTLLAGSIKDAVAMWEPTIVVDDIQMRSQDPAGGQMIAVIAYHLTATGSSYTATVNLGATASVDWPNI